MQERSDTMSRIITIGREFGSGGREIGRRLSDALQIAYYDQEIISEIAKRTDLSEEYVQRISERRPFISFPIHVGRSFYPVTDPLLQNSVLVFAEQHRLLEEMSEKSDCLIVGRCADYILREKKPFRIFVYADMESRLQRCMSRKRAGEEMSEKDMKKRIGEIDRERSQYYSYFSDRKWGTRDNYDLMVNTSGKDIKQVSIALADYLKKLMF